MYEAQGNYAEALATYTQAIALSKRCGRRPAVKPRAPASLPNGPRCTTRSSACSFSRTGGDAFLTSERGRARAFLDSLATGQVELSDDAAADLLADENEAYAVRQSAEDALARAQAPIHPTRNSSPTWNSSLAAAEPPTARRWRPSSLAGIS